MDSQKCFYKQEKKHHLEMDGWKMTFLFGARPIFRGELLVLGRVVL